MANNEIKTNAEIYREQRKARLAKAAKKKKSGKGDKIIRVLVKTLCIVLIAGIVLYGVGNILTKVFCLPQKVLTVAKYEDEKVTVAEFNYYYLNLYNQIVSTTQQIDSYYGSGYGAYYTGFDTKLDPAEQDYVGEDVPEGVETWADYFEVTAPEKAIINKIIYKEAMSDEAKKAGFELSQEQKDQIQADIDEVMETVEKNAEEYDYSVDNYISQTCGQGLTEKSYTELMERDSVVNLYLEWMQEDMGNDISDADVKEYYKSNRDLFDYASARLFSISYADKASSEGDPVYTKAQAKARATDFLGKITDEASFISLGKEYALPSQADTFKADSATLAENIQKSSVSSSSEELAEWIFDAARKAGDKTIIDDTEDKAFYIVYITKTAAPDRGTAGADVRHILVEAATEDEDGKKLSQAEIDANFAAAKKEADALLKEWKSGEASESSFANLASVKTDDTGSAETGGLYEDITSTSSYVPEFLDWALDTHKVGDTGIIKTDYGYHIMYFVGADKAEKWESDVRDAIATEDFEEYSAEILEKIQAGITRTDIFIDLFIKDIEDKVAQQVAYYKSSASSGSTISY